MLKASFERGLDQPKEEVHIPLTRPSVPGAPEHPVEVESDLKQGSEKSSIKSESFSYQATFSLVDGYRLVQHLSEHIDRARNFVCHKLHHCGPVRHHHVQVSLINICETRGSQF